MAKCPKCVGKMTRRQSDKMHHCRKCGFEKPFLTLKMEPKMADEIFLVGDRVKKVRGYAFPGVIVAKFTTQKGYTRYVVECDVEQVSGILHIYSGKDLTHDKD